MKRVVAAKKFMNIDSVNTSLKSVLSQLERFKDATESYNPSTIKKLQDAYDAVNKAVSIMDSI